MAYVYENGLVVLGAPFGDAFYFSLGLWFMVSGFRRFRFPFGLGILFGILFGFRGMFRGIFGISSSGVRHCPDCLSQ